MSEVEIKLHNLHAAQQKILNEAQRFNVLKCGRRFGKTDLSKELTIQPMLDGFPIGYWTPTYKDLDKVWDDICSTLKPIISDKSEQLKKIKIITGGSLDMWSMEDPDSGRGFFYKRAIIDEAEKAKKLKEAWEQTIRATLVDLKGDAWFMSTPKFGQTYFKGVLFKNELTKKNWKSFRFTSFDNPFLDPAEILDAQIVDDLTFRCEYLAEDVDVTLRAFANQFKRDKHVSNDPEYDYRKQLIMCVDFNIDPFCITFWHVWRDERGIHCHMFDELPIVDGNIPEMIDIISMRYSPSLPNCILTGDASGNKRDISQRDNASYFQQLMNGLGLRKSQLKSSNNPTHKDSRADTNYTLFHFPDFKIHSKCEGTIRDMLNVQVDIFGQIVKRDRKDINQQADFLDTVRYIIHNVLYKWIKEHQKQNLGTFPKTGLPII